MNVVSRFGLFGKEVSLRGDHANGLIDDFASISSTEPDFILRLQSLINAMKLSRFGSAQRKNWVTERTPF